MGNTVVPSLFGKHCRAFPFFKEAQLCFFLFDKYRLGFSQKYNCAFLFFKMHSYASHGSIAMLLANKQCYPKKPPRHRETQAKTENAKKKTLKRVQNLAPSKQHVATADHTTWRAARPKKMTSAGALQGAPLN